jgi:hypothetical protein
MITWYSGAVALSLTLLVAAMASGATLPDVLVGVSTGIIATTAMIFVVQKIIEDIAATKDAPATLVALSLCARIYQTFQYTWIEMGASRNLVKEDTDWDSREYSIALQREMCLQEKWRGALLHDMVFLNGVRSITWEQYIDMTRDLIRNMIDDLLKNHITYLDPDIVTMLYVLRIDAASFCGSFFDNLYKGKQRFEMADNEGLYKRLQTDIYTYSKLREKIDELYDSIQHSRKEAIWRRLMYGATKPNGAW